MMQPSIFNDTTIRPQKTPPTAVGWDLLVGGGFHLCCSAMLSCCPAAVLYLDMLSLSCPADHCLPAALPRTDRNFWPGCLRQLPQNCRTLGHLQCRSLYIANRKGERDRGETETVNGIGAILKLETSRRVMGIYNALLQLFWATLELLWC